MTVSKQMRKMLIIVGIVFGIIFGWYGVKKIFFIWAMSHYAPPPVTVSGTQATAQTWQSYLNSVGTITAINGVDISAETSGIVKEIHFESGQLVNQGDLLVLLDTSVEEAQLRENQARLKLAQLNYDRDKVLIKRSVIAQASYDTDYAQLAQAQASVDAMQARIKLKSITAPFSGKIGIRQIDIGEYLSAGTPMVTLQSLDPLYVRFNLPEQYLPNLFLDQAVDISVNLSGGGQSIRGKVTAINAKIDQATRNILVQATIPNKDLKLLPGMFALVKVWLPKQQNVIILPETAISYSLHGDSVFVIKPEGKDDDDKPILNAYREYVTVGERRGNQVSVLKGVKSGIMVVTSGQLKLQNGTHVVIDNSVEL
jgi:membrane fusion protein (multidrug efflux system)